MTPSSLERIHCPKCSKPLDPTSHDGGDEATCIFCQQKMQLITYPALEAELASPKPTAAKVEAGATCFYHDENEAVHTCSHCGRYLCSVCGIEETEGITCPSCISTQRASSTETVSSRILYDRLVLGLAFLPLLIWPFTVVTAPIAVGVGIYGWRQPRSLVSPGRIRMVIGMVFAVIQVGVWAFFLGAQILS